ncbi:hypothetical protein [Methylobacillus flagellatus]|uniref:hypothetical protein n=1 Tax=Methylobacillus flagellatus TaxID=405 RepID=UPI0010F68BBA|nr:hypothetical protein [Methylobacillus flagellatus]
MNALYWQLRHQLRQGGWLLLAGLLSALAALYVQHWQNQPLQQHIHLLQQQAAQPAPPPISVNTISSSAAFVNSLPAPGQLSTQLRTLHTLAEQHELPMGRVDYKRTSISGTGVQQYQVSYLLTAEYPQLRLYLADLLHTLPNAALLGLELERFNEQASMVDASIRLGLYLREAP